MPSIFKRGSQCAHHSNDKSGKTWNPYGDLCPAIGDDQWPLLYAGVGVCVAGLLGLGIVFAVRTIRAKRRENDPLEVPQRPADVMGSPLLKEKRSSRFHDGASIASRTRSNSFAPTSPLSLNSNHEFPPQQQPQPYRDNLRVEGGSQSSHSSHSAYSPRPESLHFPILSANGQLLPRPPASSRNSYVEPNDPFGPQRILPTPPPAQISEPRQLGRPVDQWQYVPEQTPSPERENFYNSRHHEPTEVLRDDRTRAYAGIPQPQAATYHRSLSAEGEDMSEPDYGSDEEDHPRRSQLVYDRR